MLSLPVGIDECGDLKPSRNAPLFYPPYVHMSDSLSVSIVVVQPLPVTYDVSDAINRGHPLLRRRNHLRCSLRVAKARRVAN